MITVMSHPNSVYSVELFSYIYINWSEKLNCPGAFKQKDDCGPWGHLNLFLALENLVITIFQILLIVVNRNAVFLKVFRNRMYLFFSWQCWAWLPEYFCLFPNTNSWQQVLIPIFPTTLLCLMYIIHFQKWFELLLVQLVMMLCIFSRLALHEIFCDERYRYSLKETLSADLYQQLLAVSTGLTLVQLCCRDTEKSLSLQLYLPVSEWNINIIKALPIWKILTFTYKTSCFHFEYLHLRWC